MMKRRVAGYCVAGLFLVSCNGSANSSNSSNPPNDPAATFATLPTSTPAATEPSSDSDPEAPTTLPLEPAGNLDLPTATPDELANGPATTTPTGPLPIPAVALVEVGQFDAPVELTSRPGDPRAFVVEQGGRIVAFDDLSTEVVLDMSDLTQASGERGLLGLAFHPAIDLAYVHYNDLNGNTKLDEYAIDPVTAVFDVESRRQVLTVEQPYSNHNGGEVVFGPDGYLYLGLGDGGSANDPQRNSLALASRLGKILRIDPQVAGSDPFTVPPGNPFVGVDGADPAIWSLGLRNPWKFSFDSATGDLWVADVGQGQVEEINFAPAVGGQGAGKGVSFGWSAFEGSQRFNDDQDAGGHISPVVEYSHDNGNCSVSGGAVYRGTAVADLAGWYAYGDFCTGLIWAYDPTSKPGAPIIVELATLPALSAIAVGGEGDLFAISNTGIVSRFAPA